MIKIYVVFKHGHVIRIDVDTKKSVLEAIKVAEYHQEYCGTPDCHFEVWAKGSIIHSTKQLI